MKLCQGQARAQLNRSLPPPNVRKVAATLQNQSLTFLVGLNDFADRVKILPEKADHLLSVAFEVLEIPEELRQNYCQALHSSVGGWASWCAYHAWQSQFEGKQNTHLSELLAIRVAWELLLDDGLRTRQSRQAGLVHDLKQLGVLEFQRKKSNDLLWLCQRALEKTYQDTLALQFELRLKEQSFVNVNAPKVQAYFCIDVRSEVFRRAWEAEDEYVQTCGFAGFFGLPIDYTPLGTPSTRPHLPGLLSPKLHAVDAVEHTQRGTLNLDEIVTKRKSRLKFAERWNHFQSMPSSGFTFVETTGGFSFFKLIQNSLPVFNKAKKCRSAGLSNKEFMKLTPQLDLGDCAENESQITQKVLLAKNILTAMFRTKDFARIVLLVGHGSQSENNAFAASLDCGACCGQTGEVNACILAKILNESPVRRGLQAYEIYFPDTTLFVAALHNTTRDMTQSCG